MLVEFRAENHRSLRDEQALTMLAGQATDRDDCRPRTVSGFNEHILPVAAIYGANASGKSNVLSALAFMQDAIMFSHRHWAPEERIPREAFAWGPKRNESSLFEVSFLLEAVRYQYGFEASSERFLEEWLYAWPRGKKQVWYERDDTDFKFGENLKGENRLIAEVTRPNALFLSAAAQLKHPQLSAIFGWFLNLSPLNMPPSPQSIRWRVSSFSPQLVELIDDSRQPTLFRDEAADSLSNQFRAMLRNADVGIVDIRTVKTESMDDRGRRHRVQIMLEHKSTNGGAWLPLEEESQGTQKLFRMALPVLQAIRRGGLLFVDELESSLHPSLAREIVNLFNDPRKNPNNAQLIFSTHDTNLLGTTLGEPALRRDQVWLTEKDDAGGTVLYPLTNYKPRKSENLERGYLQGRYGAIPFLGKFAWENEETSHGQSPPSAPAPSPPPPPVSGT